MKNSLRRIFALALAVMMIAALGMSAMAVVPSEDTNGISTVEFTKKLTKEAKAYAPNTTYTFTIAAGTPVDAGEGQDAIYAGNLAGVAFVPAANQTFGKTGEEDNDDVLVITSTPAESDIDKTELVYNGTIEIDLDATVTVEGKTVNVFENPGIYRYTVTESDGGYAGMTYETAAHTLDIYVMTEADGDLYIAGYAMYETDNETKVDNFANKYDTADVKVTKTVTGNLGDRDKQFAFTVTITGTAGEKYYIEKYTSATATTASATYTAEANTACTGITLADGEFFKIYGLSATDSYTIVEEDCTNDGYTTTVEAEEDEVALTGSGDIEAVEEGKTVADEDVTFTNNKEATVPTGIAMTVLPFVAMLALAAVVAILFFRKKERREA